MFETILAMMRAINLGAMPREVLQALPPRVELKKSPANCQHTSCKRFGDAHGRFATCLQCGSGWKWSQEAQMWETRDHPGSKGRSTHLQPLPPPSSATISEQPPGASPKAKAAYRLVCGQRPEVFNRLRSNLCRRTVLGRTSPR